MPPALDYKSLGVISCLQIKIGSALAIVANLIHLFSDSYILLTNGKFRIFIYCEAQILLNAFLQFEILFGEFQN